MSASIDATVAAETAPPPSAAVSDGFSPRGWYVVYMTGLVAIMSQIDRGVLALFVQPMKRDYHLTDTQVSILLGFAFTFFYVVGGPPLSRLADRGVRKSVIAGCLAVWSLATAFCTIAQSFWAFFLARAVVGGTEAGCGPASLSMITDAVPRHKLPLANAIYNSGFVGGGALSLLLGGVLLGALADVQPIPIAGIGLIHNWQLVFMMLGIPGLIIALIFFVTVPEPARRGAREKPGGYPLREVIGFVVRERAMHFPFITASLLMSFQVYGLGAWMPAFFERTYGWGPSIAGPLLGLSGLVATVIGMFAGAWLAGWMAKRDDGANMRVYFLAQVLAMPFGIMGPLMPNPWLAIGCVAIGGMAASMAAPVFSAALQLTTPNEMRSQVLALYFILANAIAGSLGPTVVALITDYVAQDEANLRYVMTGIRCVIAPLGFFFMWRAIAPYRLLYRKMTTPV